MAYSIWYPYRLAFCPGALFLFGYLMVEQGEASIFYTTSEAKSPWWNYLLGENERTSALFDLAFREKDCFIRVVRPCFSRKRLFHQGGSTLLFAKKIVSSGWCDLGFREKEGFTRVVWPCFLRKRGFHQGGVTMLFAKKRVSPGWCDHAFREKEGFTRVVWPWFSRKRGFHQGG